MLTEDNERWRTFRKWILLPFKGTKEGTSVNFKQVGANEGGGNSASQEEIEIFIKEQKHFSDICPQ